MLRRIFFASLFVPMALGAQHDPGRNAVRKLAKGDHEAAVQELHKSRKRNSPVDEAEKYVVRALSASLQGDGKTALQEAKLAVQHGAHPGRFAAGPKDAFAALYQAKGYEEWASSFDLDLVHGPMIGAVTGHSASIWLRTESAARVSVNLSCSESDKLMHATTSAETDFTAVVHFDGLEPETTYEVSLSIEQREVGQGSFRTTAARGEASKFTLVLGGGAGYTPQYERMWATIESHHPDALFMLGDNVYIDDPTHQLTQDYIYYRRQSEPGWRSLVSKTPTYAIYDDHDFGMNDCIPGPFIDQPAWKRPVWETFRNNWANAYYGGGDAQPGCWFDTYIGDVHFIFLDCRYYRDRSGGTMLGPVQKEWLFETLKHSKGTFKVLASSVPWSAGVKPGSRDTWDGFPAERESIFSFIEANQIDGAVLISADRHRVDVRKTERVGGYDLYEIMSSRLTNVHTHGLVKNAKGSEFILGYNATPAFAKLTFDTKAKPPTLHGSIIDIDNHEHGTFELTLDQLRHER
ncbi:alkaline phosphatase [Coraliomargarita sinensis]|uniref:Alkaline phosphatase n=1 Tax=Coraliomargarita sinensis TaxID=2174842 RepID=A0A317ZKN8_9BACT|nr:alkaline phosphatase D family protein [Coraliomargarita sinensis]PXA04783.1 alkaline phosphatase [Coraliomargarita sinensis]